MTRCDECHVWMSKMFVKDHTCQNVRCKYCKERVTTDHQCYVQTIKERENKKEQKTIPFIFFDFECRQDDGEHVPNLCVAHRACNSCIITPIDEPCHFCEPREHIFAGENTLQDFLTWLFECKRHKNATVLAHNFQGYDGQFILRYLIQQGSQPPTVIMNGAKILLLEAHGLRFIDSLSFIAQPLRRFPEAYGLDELQKGYFPHFFNTVANQNYMGPYPERHYYDPDGMSQEQRTLFNTWYATTTKRVFNFHSEFLAYCRSDVDILRRGCGKFRETILKTSDVDPFSECITLASMANRIYRQSYMPANTIAIIPTHGYQPARLYSLKGLRWLYWIMKTEGVQLQHARNGGEIKVAGYYVDGLDPEAKVIYEFNGCFWHGCPTCFPKRQQQHPVQKTETFESCYQKTLQRRHALCVAGFQVITCWEHVYDQQYRQQEEMRQFIETLDIQDPLKPREALYGGRTNATRLWYEAGPGEEIRYIDICSLYPYVLKYGIFPVGHPTIITEHFLSDLRDYQGLIKCRVLPPKELYHPVLPYKSKGKLTFPLCRTCVEDRVQISCTHTDSQRTLDGTWVTLELFKALDQGYHVVKVFEVWHFEETSTDLFKDYIDTFLKQKQEASGYPQWVQTVEDQQLYKDQFYAIEGIRLENVEKKPTKRSTAKAELNVLWG